MTKLYGVVGDPISHSLSPLIHNGWHRDLGIDAQYMAFHVPEGQFGDALKTFERQQVRGFNVTLPHKLAAFEAATTRSGDCQLVGAANTMLRTPAGDWHAHNTDLSGFRSALVQRAGEVRGQSALVLGAGGAARAVCAGLVQLGVAVAIANRTEERAKALAEALSLPPDAVLPLSALQDAASQCHLVINCLSLGHGGGELDLPEGDGRLFYDISYGKAAAPIMSQASDKGWVIEDGLSMLVAQAADAFELWHGRVPDRTLAEDRCRTALEMVS